MGPRRPRKAALLILLSGARRVVALMVGVSVEEHHRLVGDRDQSGSFLPPAVTRKAGPHRETHLSLHQEITPQASPEIAA